jgi:outer membrane lipoprotein carrier protein
MSSTAAVRRGAFLFAAALLAFHAGAVAQKASPSAQNPSAENPSAQQLAARVDHHYDSLRSLKAIFSESYTGLGMDRSESGTLLLAKPGRMRWDYDAPPGKVFLLDGKYGWFYTPGAPQVQRVAARELDDLRSPLQFLLGHTDLEKELSGLQVSPDLSDRGVLVLTGQPKGQVSRVSRVVLRVDPATGAIVGLEIDETDGAITRFTFSAQQPDAAIPPAAFHFSPPQGVPVVDAPPPV